VLTEPFQSAIPETNWMYPAKNPAAGPPAIFKDMVQPPKGLLFTPEEVLENRRAFTDGWLNATSR
jgi:thiamine transport system substrate-binding protein